MSNSLRDLALLLLLAPCSCFDSSCDVLPDPGTMGELKGGDFLYTCDDGSDLKCAGLNDIDMDFPPLLAVGGRFEVAFDPNDDSFSSESTKIQTSAPALMSVNEAAIVTVNGPGTAAIIALWVGTDELIDVLHVQAKPVAELSLTNVTDDEAMSIRASESLEVEVTPRDAAGKRLFGALPYTWTSVDESIARVTADPDNARVTTIEGVSAGLTEIELTLDLEGEDFDLTTTFSVEVSE